jgi:hypothetical protein
MVQQQKLQRDFIENSIPAQLTPCGHQMFSRHQPAGEFNHFTGNSVDGAIAI